MNIYEVSRITVDCTGPRYYRDSSCKESRIALCTSLESAEDMIRAYAGHDETLSPVHSYIVRLFETDGPAENYNSDAEYTYDSDGAPLDRWVRPEGGGLSEGHDPDECRFRPGDICEVLWSDLKPLAAIIESLPPDRESVRQALASGAFMEGDENAYLVVAIDGSGYAMEMYVDMLRVFKPSHPVHPATRRKLRKALAEYRTAPVRYEIRRIAAAQVLSSIAEETGVDLTLPDDMCWEESLFLSLGTEGLPGYTGPGKDRVEVRVTLSQIERHPDMIRGAFRLLKGLPAEGRAYRLKKRVYTSSSGSQPWVEYYF